MATVETPRTEVRAQARYVRTAPRKAQLVVDEIRGRTVPEARTILAFLARDAARDVEKVLSSAVANAEANHGLAGDDMYVSGAHVDAGPVLKRWRARARGRVARIRKRTCHITIRLAMPGDGAIPEPRGSVVLEPPAQEDAPKPRTRRAPRKEAETTETASPPEASGEEKPKRTRTARQKAEKTEETKTDAEKPKRAPRTKKREEA